jgi:hypothetical protein
VTAGASPRLVRGLWGRARGGLPRPGSVGVGSTVGLLLLAVLSPIGCGGGIASPDVFLVRRSGSIPGAALTLVVNDGGTVRCDAGPALPISDSQLVLARGIQEELKEAASKHLYLPPRPGSVLSYFLRDEQGYVRFSDNSIGQSRIMHELQAFVLEVGRGVCHRKL